MNISSILTLLCFRFFFSLTRWKERWYVVKWKSFETVNWDSLLTNAYGQLLRRPWTILLTVSTAFSHKFIAFVAMIWDTTAKCVTFSCVPAMRGLIGWSTRFRLAGDVGPVPVILTQHVENVILNIKLIHSPARLSIDCETLCTRKSIGDISSVTMILNRWVQIKRCLFRQCRVTCMLNEWRW